MVGHDERDEQDQQRWYARFARERQGLSDSVNEALADPRLQEDFNDELSDEPELEAQDSHALLIAPRLSLPSISCRIRWSDRSQLPRCLKQTMSRRSRVYLGRNDWRGAQQKFACRLCRKRRNGERRK